MTASFVAGYNPTDVPVVVDHQGRTLGGGEWGPVRASTAVIRDLVGAGRLVLHPDLSPVDDTNPSAAAAVEVAAALHERVESLEPLELDVLAALADRAGIPRPDPLEAGDAADLKIDLAYSSADLTPPAKTGRSSRPAAS